MDRPKRKACEIAMLKIQRCLNAENDNNHENDEINKLPNKKGKRQNFEFDRECLSYIIRDSESLTVMIYVYNSDIDFEIKEKYGYIEDHELIHDGVQLLTKLKK